MYKYFCFTNSFDFKNVNKINVFYLNVFLIATKQTIRLDIICNPEEYYPKKTEFLNKKWEPIVRLLKGMAKKMIKKIIPEKKIMITMGQTFLSIYKTIF